MLLAKTASAHTSTVSFFPLIPGPGVIKLRRAVYFCRAFSSSARCVEVECLKVDLYGRGGGGHTILWLHTTLSSSCFLSSVNVPQPCCITALPVEQRRRQQWMHSITQTNLKSRILTLDVFPLVCWAEKQCVSAEWRLPVKNAYIWCSAINNHKTLFEVVYSSMIYVYSRVFYLCSITRILPNDLPCLHYVVLFLPVSPDF